MICNVIHAYILLVGICMLFLNKIQVALWSSYSNFSTQVLQVATTQKIEGSFWSRLSKCFLEVSNQVSFIFPFSLEHEKHTQGEILQAYKCHANRVSNNKVLRETESIAIVINTVFKSLNSEVMAFCLFLEGLYWGPVAADMLWGCWGLLN